jgi:hypothetical protein
LAKGTNYEAPRYAVFFNDVLLSAILFIAAKEKKSGVFTELTHTSQSFF